MEFEKVSNIPSANMTQEDIEIINALDEMEIEEIARTDATPEKAKSLTRRLKTKAFRVYTRKDATYIKRVKPKERKQPEETEE